MANKKNSVAAFTQSTKSFGNFTGEDGYEQFCTMLEEMVTLATENGVPNLTATPLCHQLLSRGDIRDSGAGLSISITSLMDVLGSLLGNKYGDNLTGQVSDGYHTFDELYEHRCTLFVCLMGMAQLDSGNFPVKDIWFSTTHHDGTSHAGYVLAGMSTIHGDVSYHLNELLYRPYLETAGIKELETAPDWDGHTSHDVLDRLVQTFINN